MAIKIVTDSTSDIPRSLQKKLGITILPLTVHFGREEYIDGVNLSPALFYEKLAKATKLPTTSQIPVGKFMETFDQLSANGDEVLGIFISSKLSGTYQSAFIAKQTLYSRKIQVVDSLNTSFALYLLVAQAVRMRDAGATLIEIVSYLENIKHKVTLLAVIDNLTYLQKGGRLSNAGAAIGTLLKVKPLVTIKEGNVQMIHKVRGIKKAFEWMVEQAAAMQDQEQPAITCGSTNSPEMLSAFITMAGEKLDVSQAIKVDIGIIVGTHAGPGCVGIAFIAR